jgi:hypothetical protein
VQNATVKNLDLSVRLAYFGGMKKVKPKLTPFPVPIPLDYAEVLDVDRSHISHANAGRRPLGEKHWRPLLQASLTDPRLEGLHILHFKANLDWMKPWLDIPFPSKPPKKKNHGK